MGPRDGLQSIKEIVSSEKKNKINKPFTIYPGLMDNMGSFVSLNGFLKWLTLKLYMRV